MMAHGAVRGWVWFANPGLLLIRLATATTRTVSGEWIDGGPGFSANRLDGGDVTEEGERCR